MPVLIGMNETSLLKRWRASGSFLEPCAANGVHFQRAFALTARVVVGKGRYIAQGDLRHTKMEVLQRQAYGFRNFDKLRVRVMCSQIGQRLRCSHSSA